MRIRAKHRRRLALAALHLWWLWLSEGYLRGFWLSPAVGGIDGSGHVAALHLYARHVYPDIQGWLPEFFGGMPFPVFYPPLFYWLGATLMKFGGLDATQAAKLLTVLSFAALPGVLFGLGRRLGLTTFEATAAAALAGVVACGENLAALFSVGLAGLFEIGLYTHTAGFVWLCVWCGALPHSRRSCAGAAATVASLAAMVLTNVHVLPLAAAYGSCWFLLDGWRAWRLTARNRGRRLLSNSGRVALLISAAVMTAAVWWVPLAGWHRYTLGQPQEHEWLFGILGLVNLMWIPCGVVALFESRQRPALSALCFALLLAAASSVLPLDKYTTLPFQPWRLITAASLLATIPTAFLCSRLLKEVLRRAAYRAAAVAAALVVLSWLHPPAPLAIGVLTPAEANELRELRAALRELPGGGAAVEIFEIEDRPDFASLSPSAMRNRVVSRALAHQLAEDGRPVLWSIFREHAVSAALATAVRNLFSTTPEKFGIDGLALELASQGGTDADLALRLAGRLGVAYYVVKSPGQVTRLKNRGDLNLLKQVGGWHVFASKVRPTPPFEPVTATPVMAWLPARFRNRSPGDFDLFNLSELMAFKGRPDVCVVWASGSDASVWDAVAKLPSAVLLIDPSEISSPREEWLGKLEANAPKLEVLLLDDKSELAGQVHKREALFARYERLDGTDSDGRALTAKTAERLLAFTALPAASPNNDWNVWRVNTSYFPAWETEGGQPLWLNGEGRMASPGAAAPTLRWKRSPLQLLGALMTLAGIAVAVLGVYSTPSRRLHT